MSDVTRILSAIEDGNPAAAEQLLPLVYDELRRLAAQKMAEEKPGQTIQGTALVHEAYIRLVDKDKPQHWNGRGHFYAAAAEATDNTLRVWETETGKELCRFDPGQAVQSVAFSPDGRSVLSGGREPFLLLWELSEDLITAESPAEVKLLATEADAEREPVPRPAEAVVPKPSSENNEPQREEERQ